MTKSIKIPIRWKAKWFLQGFVFWLGFGPTKEQKLKEIKQCVDEIKAKETNWEEKD